MKVHFGRGGPGGPFDLSGIFDQIFEATEDIRNQFANNFPGADVYGRHRGGSKNRTNWAFDENTDYYPNYSYPPMNVFMTGDKSLVFEFALAGFEEKDISLSFQGDYMIFSAAISAGENNTSSEVSNEEDAKNEVRYFKRRLKMKDIEKQKYFVPLDKYAQDQVKAVFRNGILKVSIPPKDEPEHNEGIKIEIISE